MVPRIPATRFVRASKATLPLSRLPVCHRLTAQRRYITADEKPLPTADKKGAGPNQDQLPHASEEAAAMGKITGDAVPDLDQGTPVSEVINRDGEGKKNAPEVLKDSKTSAPKGSRSYSTSTRRMQESMLPPADKIRLDPATGEAPLDAFDLAALREAMMHDAHEQSPSSAVSKKDKGHKFGLPELPIGKFENLKHRYDPVVKQVTHLLLRDGKLARAQTNMALILNHLRTAPAPLPSSSRPLLPGAPPLSHLPLNPILYLTLAIDSVAPLLRIRSQKGAAGGGMALQLPVPLHLRQRRRQAVKWILDVIEKKSSRGSGKGMFAQKFAEEVIAIVEGKSAVWEKRGGVHKLGVAARSNLMKMKRRR